ncbi:MAG TPA: GTP 3',8-cyclase MoaA [Solimonas sp.]|nr:GTP 3',8-cyclase MoaA [Solimonas sp.]
MDSRPTPALADRHGRPKRKLRISLTDRCNFRCPYCMPEKPAWLPRERLLTRRELRRLLGLFVCELGITHLRLTGGEPLLRADLGEIVAEAQEFKALGLQRVSLTTNGVLLGRRAAELKAAGLDDLNVSLDALDPAAFAALSGGRSHPLEVLDGIAAARAAGLPLKLNTVVMRGYNEDQVLPLVRHAYAERIPLRLIEFMPLDGGGRWNAQRVVGEAEILAALAPEFHAVPLPESDDPARHYLLNGCYQLGVISTVSRPFCKRCDRLRLTAEGELYTCLFSARGHDLRTPLRSGASDAELLARIRTAVWNKPAGYAQGGGGYVERPISMHGLGG